MRSTLSLALLVMFLPSNSMAYEPVIEPHVMIYYQVPLGQNSNTRKQQSFGFRLDRAVTDSEGMIEFQQLMNRPAVLDFKFNQDGVKGIYLSGENFLQKYRLYRASEETGTEMDEMMEEASDELTDNELAGGMDEGMEGEENVEVTDETIEAAAAERKKKGPNPAAKMAKDVGETMDIVFDVIPLGFLIGGAIGVVLLVGAN